MAKIKCIITDDEPFARKGLQGYASQIDFLDLRGVHAARLDLGDVTNLNQVENVANFQAYGFLPELVARFTRVIPFRALDSNTLKDILTSDVVARMAREFKLEGFDLAIDDLSRAADLFATIHRRTDSSRSRSRQRSRATRTAR